MSTRKKLLDLALSIPDVHLSSCLSCVEIMDAIFQVKRPQDHFILSKGHAAYLYYLKLAEQGYFPESEIPKYGSHPSDNIPGVEVSSGSLGNGLGVGAGMALAEPQNRVYVLLGDGECYEGSVWEAAMFAGNQRLHNLVAVVDYNKLMIMDFTHLEPFADKWKAFNWVTYDVDGHNLEQLVSTFQMIVRCQCMPSVVIAHTVKGKGIPAMEGKLGWHGRVPKGDECILQELTA